MNGAEHPSRREFLKVSAAVGVGSLVTQGSLAAEPQQAPIARAHGGAPLRIALVGCGGRGTGAVADAMSTQGPVKLVAMADAFEDRLEQSLKDLQTQFGDRIDVPRARQFVGFDAYHQAIDCDVDLVILTTPPGFRPLHFKHAVARNRHVFMEKPVAVDAPGVRMVLDAGKEAARKNLKVGVGLQRRHSPMYRETIQRIWDGAVGDITLLRVYWNGAGVWVHPRAPGMTEMQYQMRNWYYFNWLCGDHIVEQHIHNLDVGNWVMRGYPVSAQGQGGRQMRIGPDYGEIYDHHMVEFTYADGTRMLSQCRHIADCWDSVSEHVHGARGVVDCAAGKITANGGWSFKASADPRSPYEIEHEDLHAAIRNDTPYNEAEYGALSTMTAIMGRMATYSGKVIAWQDALASELSLQPKTYAWDAQPNVLPDEHGLYPAAKPGATQVL
ncbi:MAG: Gfo/Idh/MocA family oxidoreductase [Planctomycetota bacterium]